MQLNNRQRIELCILIPCFNNLEGLIKSLNSINYKIKNFIVIIVDDGSAKAITNEDVKQQLINNLNLNIIRLNLNIGITETLNKGLEYIYDNFLPEYIARLDCGDICAPNRFFAQIDFLKNNTGIHLLGSWCYFKDVKTGKTYKYITPTIHHSIIRGMNFRNIFIHPTVIWRYKDIGAIKYPYNYPNAEDYGLFYNIVSKFKSAVLGEFLVTCEINQKGISQKNRLKQLKSRQKVIFDYRNDYFLYMAGELKLIMLKIIPYKFILDIKYKIFNN